ncbi:MAG: hypothetical protein V1709_11600 [Planctomycetota bacterium]
MVFACLGLMVVLIQGIAIGGESQEKYPFSEDMCFMDMEDYTLMDMMDMFDEDCCPFPIALSINAVGDSRCTPITIDAREIRVSLSEIKMDELSSISVSINGGSYCTPTIKLNMMPNNLLDMFDSENSACCFFAISCDDDDKDEENEEDD